MSLADMIRKRAAQLHLTWAEARPSLVRNGLQGFTDYDPGDEHGGFIPLETGHHLYLGASDREDGTPAQWKLHITHDTDYQHAKWGIPNRKVIADLGTGNHDVGDRVMKALRHPEVMKGMRRLMVPPQGDEWWNHEVSVR